MKFKLTNIYKDGTIIEEIHEEESIDSCAEYILQKYRDEIDHIEHIDIDQLDKEDASSN